MRAVLDKELRDDFEKLIISLGEDVTNKNVMPMVKAEFKNVAEYQERLLRHSQDEILQFSTKVNGEMGKLLAENLRQLSFHKDTIEKLNNLNGRFIKNLDNYVNSTDIKDRTDEILDYNKNLQSRIEEYNTLYSKVFQESQEYLNEINRTIANLDGNLSDINKLNRETISSMAAINNELIRLTKLINNEIRLSLEKSQNDIKSLKSDQKTRLDSITDMILNSKKSHDSNLHKMRETLVGGINRTLKELEGFHTDQAEDNEAKDLALEKIEDDIEKTYMYLHNTNNEAKSRYKYLIAINLGMMAAILYLIIYR